MHGPQVSQRATQSVTTRSVNCDSSIRERRPALAGLGSSLFYLWPDKLTRSDTTRKESLESNPVRSKGGVCKELSRAHLHQGQYR